VLDAQSFRRTNRSMVTLYEDGAIRILNQSRRRHWTRAAPRYKWCSSRTHSFVSIEVTKDQPHFVICEGGPVRFDE